jgi:hypothetical protein
MAKEKPQIRDITDVLNNPSDKSKLDTLLAEACRCKLRIADENEAIKDLRIAARDDLGVEPKMFNSLLKVSFNGNPMETQHELSALDIAISILFKKELEE